MVAGDAGETAIVGRFERVFSATSVMILKPDPKFVATPSPQDHLIDRHVIDKLNRGNTAAACGQLGAFINQVQAQSGKALMPLDAATLIGMASDARAASGCQ